MNERVQSLRGLFVFSVFLSHYAINGKVIFDAVEMTMTFFFILSGFCLAYAYANKSVFWAGKFYINRIRKIYPLHIFCWIYAVWYYDETVPKIDVTNLLLLQSWVPDFKYVFSLNSVSWFLSDLVFCYALFPWLLKFMHKYRKIFVICSLIFIMGVAFVYLPYMGIHLRGQETAILYRCYIFPPARLGGFLLGILLYLATTRFENSQCHRYMLGLPGFVQNFILLLIISLFIGCCLLQSSVISNKSDILLPYIYDAVWWLPNMLLIGLFFAFPKWDGLLFRLTGTQPLVWFGNISFSFYLVHVLVISGFGKLFESYGWNFAEPLRLTIIFALAVLVSWLVQKIIVNTLIRQPESLGTIKKIR